MVLTAKLSSSGSERWVPTPAQTVLSSQKNNFLFQFCPRAALPAHALWREPRWEFSPEEESPDSR
jgi:hypothetical protein